MGADNLISFHKWQKWQKIFSNMSIVIFKRHGYNTSALKSIASTKYNHARIFKSHVNYEDFDKLPSWTIIENKEIRISSTEIRNQRDRLRGKN